MEKINVNDLPLELITEIFAYLPRKDRISCSMVCTRWKEALDTPHLWRNLSVHFDSDLIEQSTAVVTKLYHPYFKSMEFSWTSQRSPTGWMQCGSQEFSKRVSHYLMILQDSYIQLESIKIGDWYEVPKFKKIVYHLCKFLRSQTSLKRVGFWNTNFHRVECVKLLSSCLESVNTLKYLDISNCYHADQINYESVTFLSCIEHLRNLQVLRIDYQALSGGVIEALMTNNTVRLKYLDIIIREYHSINTLIPEKTWTNLRRQCPFLQVGLYIKNVCHYDEIYMILKQTIPLTTFSLKSGRVWDQCRSRQYRRTISLLTNNYYATLENVYLKTNYHLEVLDDVLLNLISKCINLKHLDFRGIIGSMDLLKEICKTQTDPLYKGFKHFRVVPKNINAKSHFNLTKLHEEFEKKLKDCQVEFKICNDYNNKNMVYVYY